MRRVGLLSVALLASGALAAPAPKQSHAPHVGHFTAAVQGQKSAASLDPLAEMKHVFGKYDWTFDVSKFESELPNLDLSKGSSAATGAPKAAGAAQKDSDGPPGLPQLPDLPDLLNGLGDILGGGSDDTSAAGEPQSTLSTVVKPSHTRTKKPKSTAASSLAAIVTGTSSPAPSPPAYSAPPPETTTTESSSTTSTPEPSTEAPTTSAPPPTTSDTSTSSTPIETPSTAPEPIPSPSLSSSAPGTYTPSFAFEPTTSAVPETSSEAPSTSSTIAVPTSTKQTTGGTVTATPEQNESEYLSPVSVGGQTLNLNFDTGSADLWVFSSSLSAAQKANHVAFDPSQSSTWQPADGYTWSIAYGDGSTAAGTVGYDTVVVGGATATRQAVEIATTISDKFAQDVANDGLVGLAFSSINTVKPQQQKTFFENIMPSLDQPLFTADLRQDTQTSTYEFGVIDTSKYQGDIYYTPIDNSQGHWQFPSTTYTINGQSYTNANAPPAIADTGTSLILVDQSVVTAYYGSVSGSSLNSQVGGYTYPCSATLPDFGVQIGSSGYTAVVPGSQMTYADLGNGNCFGGLQSNGGGNYQIFGDMLFKQYFAVFNGGAKTFGVALKA